MNTHHSLLFSTRWTNQTQKNEGVRVFGSIWLRSSHSHVRQTICGGWWGLAAYGSEPHRFGWMRPNPPHHPTSPSTHQEIEAAPRGKLIPFLHCGLRFPNNGDPPAGFGASQDVHLFKGRGRGGGLSGVNLTAFPNNLDTFRETFWPTAISNINQSQKSSPNGRIFLSSIDKVGNPDKVTNPLG